MTIRVLTGMLLLASVIACKQNPSNGYVIHGKLDHAPANTQVVRQRLDVNEAVPLDTATTDATGAFAFKGDTKEETLLQLRYGNNGNVLLVVSPNDKDITIRSDFNQNGQSYNVSGSSRSIMMRNLIDTLNGWQRRLISYYKVANDSTQPVPDSVRAARFNDYRNLSNRAHEMLMRYADTVQSPATAVFVVTYLLNPETDLQFINTLSKKLSSKFPTNALVAQLATALQPKSKNQPDEDQLFANGALLPDIQLPSPDGRVIKLSSLRGKYVLVDFWASWCMPCRGENPNVVKAYNEYKDKGFTVYSVSLDNDKSKWTQAIAADKLAWQNHVSELKGWQSLVCQTFGIQSIPSNYLIDPQGKVIGHDLRGAALEQVLLQALK